MKKLMPSLLIIILLINGLFISCMSFSDMPIPQREIDTLEIIGTVEVTFTAFQLFNIKALSTATDTSFKSQNSIITNLLVAAKNKYGRDVDVRNIRAIGTFSGHNLWVWPLSSVVTILPAIAISGYDEIYVPITLGIYAFYLLMGNFQKITATADVVIYKQNNIQNKEMLGKDIITTIDVEAIQRGSNYLIRFLPEKSTIAVINVSSNNNELSAFVADRLEYHLVGAQKFQMVDRRTIDIIRTEQHFQMSGEVSDSSAVSIGQMLGATIVITGSITRTGTTQMLSLKALDVKTSQIISMAQEEF